MESIVQNSSLPAEQEAGLSSAITVEKSDECSENLVKQEESLGVSDNDSTQKEKKIEATQPISTSGSQIDQQSNEATLLDEPESPAQNSTEEDAPIKQGTGSHSSTRKEPQVASHDNSVISHQRLRAQMLENLPEDLRVAAEFADVQDVAFQMASASLGAAPSLHRRIVEEESDDEDSSDDESVAENTVKTLPKASVRSDEEADEPSAKGGASEIKEVGEDGTVPPKTAHEIEAPLQVLEISITPEHTLEHCGSILHVNKQELVLVIKGIENTTALDSGSVLCLETRDLLGAVDEVFGPVSMPLYAIRFSNNNVIPTTATPGAKVFFVKNLSSFVVRENLITKGSDASNLYDEEPDASEIEFSDDEAEAAAKAAKKAKKRNRKMREDGVAPDAHASNATGNGTGRGQRGQPWRQNPNSLANGGSSYQHPGYQNRSSQNIGQQNWQASSTDQHAMQQYGEHTHSGHPSSMSGQSYYDHQPGYSSTSQGAEYGARSYGGGSYQNQYQSSGGQQSYYSSYNNSYPPQQYQQQSWEQNDSQAYNPDNSGYQAFGTAPQSYNYQETQGTNYPSHSPQYAYNSESQQQGQYQYPYHQAQSYSGQSGYHQQQPQQPPQYPESSNYQNRQ